MKVKGVVTSPTLQPTEICTLLTKTTVVLMKPIMALQRRTHPDVTCVPGVSARLRLREQNRSLSGEITASAWAFYCREVNLFDREKAV